jgi:threonine/homoserine efflux transporter RhtA
MPPPPMTANHIAAQFVFICCLVLGLALLGTATFNHDPLNAIGGGALSIAGIHFAVQLVRAKRHDAAKVRKNK